MAKPPAARASSGESHYLFNRRFEQMRASYTSLLHWSSIIAAPVLVGFAIFVVGIARVWLDFIGRDFFPTVDSGQMRLHAPRPRRHPHRSRPK